MTNNSKSICTVCGLLCPNSSPEDRLQVRSCPLAQNFFTSPTAKQSAHVELETIVHQVQQVLGNARRPLIWIDGADVAATRAAVALAWKHQAAVHIPQSQGGRGVQQVVCSDGWLGTTLADAAEHAHLVITLGTSWLNQMPLLLERWIRRSPANARNTAVAPRQWWQIGSPPSQTTQLNSFLESRIQNSKPDQWLRWPRCDWYPRFSEVVRGLNELGQQGPPSIAKPNAAPVAADDEVARLVHAIGNSPNTTIVWEQSELDRPEDEMLVYRLLNLARIRNRTARCNLLPLNADVGRETARETLLWLTGCDCLATPHGDHWVDSQETLSEPCSRWLPRFDAILMVRNTPSVTPLPDIGWQIALVGHGIACHHADSSSAIPVALAGVHAPAFLLRGDRGVFQFAAVEQSQVVYSASQILQLAASRATTESCGHTMPPRPGDYSVPGDCSGPSDYSVPGDCSGPSDYSGPSRLDALGGKEPPA
jgi:hypothetical protein